MNNKLAKHINIAACYFFQSTRLIGKGTKRHMHQHTVQSGLEFPYSGQIVFGAFFFLLLHLIFVFCSAFFLCYNNYRTKEVKNCVI